MFCKYTNIILVVQLLDYIFAFLNFFVENKNQL
jgi:hypothetical protein